MGRIGPTLLLPMGYHRIDEAPIVKDVGGMLHKAVQLVGDYDGAEVRISGSIDPVSLTQYRGPAREQSWTEIARLTKEEPYRHHTGWVRWIRVEVVRAGSGEYGVAGMGED